MTNAKKIRAELSLEVLTPTSIPLEAKIMEFKEDPEKMDEMMKFIDDIVENAQKQAELKAIDNKVSLPYILCSISFVLYSIEHTHSDNKTVKFFLFVFKRLCLGKMERVS